ncbi:hypothetical protein [Maritimibacter sp. UBA3975]|uniref:hypothetical protein n=1 Tax=Maritimibacter sp. UBA3975 TaxID=1946833 RepID=UPI000C08F6FF|nr:hypothetical protein [Maritimibacter sp. UBA3975]MAM60565.1 hypothetical protein [Maritimibacter sp.]
MLDALTDHIEIVQLVTSLTTMLVWVVYLNIFLIGFVQQRRSSLLINRGGGEDLDSRCLISNMGAQPVYLLDVLAATEGEKAPTLASVVDRKELRDGEMERPTEITGQGPINSGAFVDIGSFREVAERAEFHAMKNNADDPKRLKLIVVAATNQAKHIVAASREFDIAGGGDVAVRPRAVEARQIRARRKRKRLTRLLNEIQQKKSGETVESVEIDRL